jgi:hypothetical protein
MRGLHAAFDFGKVKLRQLRHVHHTNRRLGRAGAGGAPKAEFAARFTPAAS